MANPVAKTCRLWLPLERLSAFAVLAVDWNIKNRPGRESEKEEEWKGQQ
jgi:hypothetical protein